MPLTLLRSAMNRPVKYSAKCRRSGSLANRSAYWAKRSCTTVGNSTIAGIPAPADSVGGTAGSVYPTTSARAVQLCKTTVTTNLQSLPEQQQSRIERVAQRVWFTLRLRHD